MGFGNMKKFCCFPLATACVLAAFLYTLHTIGIFYSGSLDGKYVGVVLNISIVVLLILGLALKNWIMFAILTVLCACDFFFSIVVVITIIIALATVGASSEVTIVALVIILLIALFSAFCLNVCYSMCKILQVGGTGWEGKSAKEIEAEKDSAASKMEKGAPREEEYNVQ